MSHASTRIAGLVSVGVVCVALGLAAATPTLAAEDTAEVGSAAEAWYLTQAATACGALACPAEPVPEEVTGESDGRLRVGVTGGQPAAHAYVQPDLARLPSGATPVSGTYTLPVSQDPHSGNAAVETADLIACLVTEQITDGVAGGTTDAPAYDCDHTASPVVRSEDSESFSVDLTPFLSTWSAGTPAYGIALVPADEQEPGSSWQVAFTGKDAEAERKISARIGYRAAGAVTRSAAASDGVAPITPPSDAEPIETATAAPAPAPPAAGEAPAGTSLPAPDEDVPAAVAAARQPELTRLTRTPWYAYPGVVYLPLVFLAGAAVIGRALSRTIKPVSVPG